MPDRSEPTELDSISESFKRDGDNAPRGYPTAAVFSDVIIRQYSALE